MSCHCCVMESLFVTSTDTVHAASGGFPALFCIQYFIFRNSAHGLCSESDWIYFVILSHLVIINIMWRVWNMTFFPLLVYGVHRTCQGGSSYMTQ